MAKAKTQIEKFRETARSLGASLAEGDFAASLKAVGRHKPSPEAKSPTRKVRKHPKKR